MPLHRIVASGWVSSTMDELQPLVSVLVETGADIVARDAIGEPGTGGRAAERGRERDTAELEGTATMGHR